MERGERLTVTIAGGVVVLSIALISIPFAGRAHHFLIDPWRSVAGTVVLLTAVLAHYANALWSIYVRRSLRLARWGW